MPIMLDSDFGGRWKVEGGKAGGVRWKVERRGERKQARVSRACFG